MLRQEIYPEAIMVSEDKNSTEIQDNSADQTIVRSASQASSSTSQASEFTAEDYRTALRLLVGAALEGNDELRKRIRNLRTTVGKRELESDPTYLGMDKKCGSPLLYTVLGLLFKTPDYLNRGASIAGRLSTRATTVVSKLMKPITHSRIMRPARQRYNSLVERGESTVKSLEKIGRSEARSSRYLVRQEETDEMLEDVLNFVVEKAKLRELIAEQSAAAATDVSTEIRQRSAAVDSSLDNIVDNLLRRQKQQTPPSSS
jgi:hypothetical protein